MRRSRKLAWAVGTACFLLLPSPAGAAEPTELAVKAAFLPRFARYVAWPPPAMPRNSDPFVLCVVGSDPFGAALDQAARSQSVDGRRIVVRRLNSAEGVRQCHVAFVEGNRAQSVSKLLTAIGSTPVLTVTDSRNGGHRGIIHFAVVGGRVRFFIDTEQAGKRGLSVSSRLLALAIGVKQ